MTADALKRLLALEPLAVEGGFFTETYRSSLVFDAGDGRGPRSTGSAIYYLLTPDTFSALHRLPHDEIFHFYLGDPVEMLQLHRNGRAQRVMIGSAIDGGLRPQVVVPGGVWQGCRLVTGGAFALLGTTMSPGFDLRDFELGVRSRLVRDYAEESTLIEALTRQAP